MATIKIKVPYLVTRKGRGGVLRFFWQPSAALRAKGWRPVSLGTDDLAAIAGARQLNADLQAWREGRRPILANDNRMGADDGRPRRRAKKRKKPSWAEILDARSEEIANAVRDDDDDPAGSE